jgi:DNA-binding ferritin-like protein (Dps family)
MKLFIAIIAFVSFSTHLFSIGEPFMLGQDNKQYIFVNNRILAKVNGKAISAIDIMKKMDMLFYKQFPQYTSSVSARFQFYKVNWKHVLQELIDKELITADAEEHKVPVSNGDVRQEMEMIFGPNIIGNLDKIGLSFDEAWEMIKEDILIRRMVYLNVNAKVIKKVTPQDIKKVYEQYAKENQKEEEWQYQVITIRNPDSKMGEKTASFISELLSSNKNILNNLTNEIKDKAELGDSKVTVSEPFKHGEKEISPLYKEELSKIEKGIFSKPIAQKSKKDNQVVYRIFYLKEKTPAGAPPFNEVKSKLENELLDKLMNDETNAYIKKLRNHYHVQEHLNLLAPDFEPFILK